MIIEHSNCKSLRKLVTDAGKRYMKEAEVKKLVQQLLKTILVMHKNNIKHGNLTLDTVLIKKKRDCLEILLSSFN